jgi:hypothetical protein
LTSAQRWTAFVAAGAVMLVSCAKIGSGGTTAQPADIYAAGPSVSDVRALFSDNNWWPGTPSFEVRPLDAASTPFTQRFSITQRFLHIGSAEEFDVRHTVYDKVSSATARMTEVQGALGASPTSPKEGDQVLYYGLVSGGGAPYITRTYVRLGQIITEIDWSRKDGIPTVAQLGRNAAKVIDGLKKVTAGKARPSPLTVNANQLPPPGLDVTLLGSTQLPIEAWLVMADVALPGPVATLLHGEGVDNFVFADYALNRDTHMEVRAALLTFASAADANDWVNTFGPGTLDQNGISSGYLDNVGEYHYLMATGKTGAMLVCRSTIDTEAASRACEAPMERTAISWKLSLTGV